MVSLAWDPVCVLLTHYLPVFQVLSRCFHMGQPTSSLKPAQTFGMVLIFTPSLALTGEYPCHLMYLGTAVKLQQELCIKSYLIEA